MAILCRLQLIVKWGRSSLWGIVLSWKVPKDSDTNMHSAPRAHARRGESEVRRAGAGSPALLAPSGRDSAFRGLRAYSSLRPFTKPTSVRNAYRSNRSSMASEPAACSCPLAGGGGAGAPGLESRRACPPVAGESEVRRAGAGSPAHLAPSARHSSFRGLRAFPALRPFPKPTSVRNAYRSNRSSMASESAASSSRWAALRSSCLRLKLNETWY